MARSFGNSHLNNLSRAASLVSNTDPRPYSVSIWLRPNTRGVRHSLFANNNSGNPGVYLEVNDNGGGTDVMRLFTNSAYNASTAFTLATGTWTHLGYSMGTGSPGAIAFYLNGVANGTASANHVAVANTTGARLGALDGSNSAFRLDGDMAEFAFWNVVLNASEWAALAQGALAWRVRPESLIGYAPIWARNAPEIDLKSATTWSVNGTLTAANHAPVRLFARLERTLWFEEEGLPPEILFQPAWARGSNNLIGGGVTGG